MGRLWWHLRPLRWGALHSESSSGVPQISGVVASGCSQTHVLCQTPCQALASVQHVPLFEMHSRIESVARSALERVQRGPETARSSTIAGLTWQVARDLRFAARVRRCLLGKLGRAAVFHRRAESRRVALRLPEAFQALGVCMMSNSCCSRRSDSFCCVESKAVQCPKSIAYIEQFWGLFLSRVGPRWTAHTEQF